MVMTQGRTQGVGELTKNLAGKKNKKKLRIWLGVDKEERFRLLNSQLLGE